MWYKSKLKKNVKFITWNFRDFLSSYILQIIQWGPTRRQWYNGAPFTSNFKLTWLHIFVFQSQYRCIFDYILIWYPCVICIIRLTLLFPSVFPTSDVATIPIFSSTGECIDVFLYIASIVCCYPIGFQYSLPKFLSKFHKSREYWGKWQAIRLNIFSWSWKWKIDQRMSKIPCSLGYVSDAISSVRWTLCSSALWHWWLRVRLQLRIGDGMCDAARSFATDR